MAGIATRDDRLSKSIRGSLPMMSSDGTGEYVVVIPDSIAGGQFEAEARSTESLPPDTRYVKQSRLVGLTPRLQVTDAGLTPDANESRPWVMRSRITIRATSQRQATVAEASFHVDRALTSRLRAGDVMHVARTYRAGLGLSVIRDDELVVAVGAVSSVPLGRGVVASYPGGLIRAAEDIFRVRAPDFEFHERPVEFTIGAEIAILYRGRREMSDYEVIARHGWFSHASGGDRDECVAIYRREACGEVAAQASAMLLDDPRAISLVDFETDHDLD
jgi:hypothetical protein